MKLSKATPPSRSAVRDGRGRPAKFPLIKQRIRSELIQGRYESGQQLPSLEKIADQFGVGGPTAKRAVDELIEEGWLESRHGVGTFVRIRKTASHVLLTAPRRLGQESVFSTENLEAFHKANPKVRVTLTADSPTDLVHTGSYTMVAEQIRERRLLSLDELENRYGRRNWEIPPAVRKYGTWQGSRFALPLRSDVYVLAINPAILKEFGLCPPTRSIDWVQYRDVLRRCRQDRDGDGLVECVGTMSKLALSEWLIPFWQRGGRLDDYEAFFDTKALDVLDELFDMHHLEKSFPFETPIGDGETASGLIAERFQKGQLAMRWTTTGSIFQPSTIPYHIVLPQFGPVQRQQSHAVMLGIHRECRHPDVAMEFLDFCYRRFVRDNAEYPFGLTEEQRRTMRLMPEIHRLLRDGLEQASEPLHEGVPERTWAIEKEIQKWLRALQDRTTMLANLKALWKGSLESRSGQERNPFLIMPTLEASLPSFPQFAETN